MKIKTQHRLKLFATILLYWILASLTYHVLRRIGLGGEIGIEVVSPLSKLEGFRIAFFIGIITGVLYGLLELIFENEWLQRKSIGTRLLIKTVAYTFLIGTVLSIAINYLNYVIELPTTLSSDRVFESGAIFSILTFFILASSLFSFFRMVNEKFGPGILFDMIRGKYRTPRVEKKIFMFLDLKSSTSLAEQMGYLKYSSLIQQCFYDLNEIVQHYHGHIYQYVGDEAVICWDYEKGVKENTCIDLYFTFRRRLYEKKEFYENNFGILPEFKAGLHGGELVVTEVGVVKKEIAYHGDVINTTSRIQDKCNEFDAQLLISGDLLKDLSFKSDYTPSLLGEVVLKGKELPVQLHSVNTHKLHSLKVPS